MPLPRLRFSAEDAKSPLLTTGLCPFALVNSNGALEFVKEAHGNLLILCLVTVTLTQQFATPLTYQRPRMLAAFVLYAPWLCFLTVSAPEPRFARAFLNVLRKPAMSLPILLFATVDAKSPLITATGRPGGRRPFALVNSNGAQNFVNEAHGNLLKTHYKPQRNCFCRGTNPMPRLSQSPGSSYRFSPHLLQCQSYFHQCPSCCLPISPSCCMPQNLVFPQSRHVTLVSHECSPTYSH